MKQILLSLLSILCFVDFAYTQITYTKFPINNQLYVRNVATNKAKVPLSGRVNTSTGYTSLRLEVYKGASLYATQNLTLSYTLGLANFSFEQEIDAELSNYTFSLFGNNGSTSTLIRTNNNIVAGDAYVIQGQSNAGFNGSPAVVTNNNFVRSFHNVNFWIIADHLVGDLGYNFADSLSQRFQMPIAIILGMAAGQSITHFERDDNNHTDPFTRYGRTLGICRAAGLDSFRAMVWYQGESDTGMALSTYKNHFGSIYSDWTENYIFEKLYIYQPKDAFTTQHGSQMLEAIRQLGMEIPKATLISSSGVITAADNTHYTRDGYSALAQRMFNLAKYELYGLPYSAGTQSPNVSNFRFTNVAKTQLQFDLSPNTDVFTWQAGTHNLFFFSNTAIQATGGSINGNTVTLDLNIPFTSASPMINYFPINKLSNQQPYVHNQNGIGMLSFRNQLIDDYTPVPVQLLSFNINAVANCEVLIEWKSAREDNFRWYEIEESKDGINFYTIAKKESLPSSQTVKEYQCLQKVNASNLYYRLKMVDNDGTASFSLVKKVFTNCKDQISVHPNPIKLGQNLNLSLYLNDAKTLQLEVYNSIGIRINQTAIKMQSGFQTASIPINSQVPGIYYLHIKDVNGKQMLKQTFQIH